MSPPRFTFLLHWLKFVCRHPHVYLALRTLGWLALVLYFAFGLTVLALRYAILPRIDNYRPDIERTLSAALHLPVSIRAIEAGWEGIRPSLTLSGLELRDAANRPALLLDHVEADLAWTSLLFLEPRLQRLEIASPRVDIRRDKAGKLSIAGLEVITEVSGDGFSDWLLAQHRVVVRDAAVTWHDELRGAAPLALSRLNFDLHNSGSRHRFGLTAEPPRQMAARFDIRGDFKGKDLDVLEAWKGEVYAELDYADLAIWRNWVDYPFELPQGSGGLRLWLGFAAKRLNSLTADVRLADVQLRLAPDLPLLDIAVVDGRLAGKRLLDGYEAEARNLSFQTRAGRRVDPMDFRLRYQAPAANREGRGEFSTGNLDLAALAELAAHLPLDARVRQKLAAGAPRGRLIELAAGWQGSVDALRTWKVKGRFADLGLTAQGKLPGFLGMSGSISGDEKGGALELASHQAGVEMPEIFAERWLEFESLKLLAGWQMADGRVAVSVREAAFQNRDAEGKFTGSYRTSLSGPGDIDLQGKLTRAAGDAVWRYMPLGVNGKVRDWLHNSLIGGQASGATLRLKGDLAKFPFRGGKDGIFEVKGKFRGATLKFAEEWPEMRDVDGEVLFENVRMLIKGQKGTLLGAAVTGVTAEIPDLESHEETLIVNGKASGPTTEFLKFIDASPIGKRIEHATAPMKAEGRGELVLKLSMPLQQLNKTRVEGQYRFNNNRLVLAADLPPLSEVNGALQFTEDRLQAQKVRANLLGAPMALDILSTGVGLVTVKAAGNFGVRELRKHFTHPLLDHFSGSAPWHAVLRVNRGVIEARLDSPLTGISSSLPEPFNKNATESRPLVFERKAGDEPKSKDKSDKSAEPHDQIVLSYGDSVRALFLRRHDTGDAGGDVNIERGVIAIGMAPPRLPERGILLAARAARLDTDLWRSLLAGGGNGNGNGGGKAPPLPVAQLDVAADDLIIHGRHFADFKLRGGHEREIWRGEVSSKAFAGHLEWDNKGAGELTGRLSRLAIPDGAAQALAADEAPPRELPAINLWIDRFTLRDKDYGEVKLRAENVDGLWQARLNVLNEDGSLVGQGRWRPPPAPLTQLDFTLEAKNVEKMLARIGYPQAVRRGKATLTGSVNWVGSPLAIDYASLGGLLKLDAANGQFSKLEPGVGRLLGVLSLQSLPRRITLDFRDIFSEGFAFDSIVGESTVAKGILQTRDLEIIGPSARVMLNGSVNLPAETQNLRVRVQPALGETVALGAVLANPAIGAVTWLAQKIFKDPLGQVFAFEYNVTGGWADPKVEKVSAGDTAKPATPPPAKGSKP